VLEAAATVRAAAAIGQRHDRDAVAFANGRDARSGRDDLAGELVPEDLRVLRAGEWMRLDGRHDRPGRVLVQVGSADAARRDADDDLAWIRRPGLRNVLDAEIPRPVEAERAHR
jgi:hypothetical protein